MTHEERSAARARVEAMKIVSAELPDNLGPLIAMACYDLPAALDALDAMTLELQSYATLTDAQDRTLKAWAPVVRAAIDLVENGLWMASGSNVRLDEDEIGIAVRALPPEHRP